MTSADSFAPTRRVLGIILAGGKGGRLYPLTHERTKPAVPFGGRHRILDFVLSNFINSGILSIYVLVQYMSQSLIDYLRSNWRTDGLTRDQFITVVPPQMRLGDIWYRGTADAVRQNLNLISDFEPDLVAVFGADHIYRMDIGQMMQFHVESGAQVTVATIPVNLKKASAFGIVEVDAKNRITSFTEKPKSPKAMPGDSNRALSSMGNYIFNTDVLVDILSNDPNPTFDFGHSILPNIHTRFKTFSYDFSTNVLPGLNPYEEKGYWRDVGTLLSYYESHMDILGPRPKFNLNNRRWPIHAARYDGPPAKILDGKFTNCIISDGCFINNATIKNSILGHGVHVGEGAVIEDSIVMDFCKVGNEARLRRAIVDRFNTIPAKESIGYSAQKDAEHYFVDSSGIVVLPRGKSKAITQ